MKEELPCIRSGCPFFACRVCRTKVGWPHQSWCGIKQNTDPGCTDCQYQNRQNKQCAHPSRKREVKVAK